ncbi:MAG: DUF370 domain-containing protein [Defluviitaleaceae bacterium]|nr:DUF370 domain-containing protein [Defluviitaleaceae bacterium]
MWNKPVNIGFGNMIPSGRIVAMVSNDSAPVKRLIQEAREKGSLIDATQGRRTRAVIVADSGHVILSAIQPETIANRMADIPWQAAEATGGKIPPVESKDVALISEERL